MAASRRTPILRHAGVPLLALLAAALFAVAFAAPSMASADEHDGDDEVSITPREPIEPLEGVVIDDADDAASGEDEAAAEATAQATGDAPCEPVLVTHRADGSSGDELAVSITAQAVEFGVAGWVNVAWQATEGAQLTAITITSTDGTRRTLTEGLTRGSDTDVLELRFCGRFDGEVSITPDPPVTEDEDTDVEVDDTPATEATPGSGSSGSGTTSDSTTTSSGATTSGGGTDGGSSATSSGSATGGSADADASADEPADDDQPEIEVRTVPTPDNGDDDADEPDTLTASDDADDADDETEVLGVQLTSDEAATEGGMGTGAVAVLLLAGALLAVGAGVGYRQLRTR